MTTEEKRAALPMIKLDRMRGHGAIFPPETLLCAGGLSIPASLREYNPSEFQLFHNDALRSGTKVTTKVRHFEQDGFSFDNEGNIIEETLDEDARDRALNMERERRAKIAARKAYVEAMNLPEGSYVDFDAGEQKPITASDMASTDPSITSQTDKLDLIAWARGLSHYHFFAVKKAFRDQYSFDPADKETALGFLVEQGKISPNAISG